MLTPSLPTLFFLPSTSNTDMAPFLYTSSPGGCFHTHLAWKHIQNTIKQHDLLSCTISKLVRLRLNRTWHNISGVRQALRFSPCVVWGWSGFSCTWGRIHRRTGDQDGRTPRDMVSGTRCPAHSGQTGWFWSCYCPLWSDPGYVTSPAGGEDGEKKHSDIVGISSSLS